MKQDSHRTEKCNLFRKQTIDNDDKIKEFTDIVGKSGRWQFQILVLTALCQLPGAWNHLAMTFLAYPVDHWCQRIVDMPLQEWQAEFLPNRTVHGKLQHSQCEMYASNATIKQCDAYEYATEFDSVVNKWDLVCDNEWMISTSQTVYMMGFLFAVLISGHLADAYGRHLTIMFSIVILIIAGFLAAFASSFAVFTICRFFVALGHASAGLTTYILLIESVGSEYRVMYMFLQGVGWHIGYMVLPLIAWYQPNWFIIQLIITAPSVVFLSFYWLLPESPRWLLANGQKDKALPILEKAARTNGKTVVDLEKQVDFLLVLSIEGKNRTKKTTVFDLLRTPKLRIKTLSLYFIWAAIAFTYYGLSLNTNDLQGNHFINFFIAGFMEIPAAIFCYVTLDRFGRKKPFCSTLMIGGLACLSCIFIPESLSNVKTGLAMVGKLFNSASFGIVYIFSSEIFPTIARNIGVGSCSTMARIGSAISPLMKDLGSATSPSVPLAMFGILSIISAAMVLKLPETNKQRIPESIDQAENFHEFLKDESIELDHCVGLLENEQ